MPKHDNPIGDELNLLCAQYQQTQNFSDKKSILEKMYPLCQKLTVGVILHFKESCGQRNSLYSDEFDNVVSDNLERLLNRPNVQAENFAGLFYSAIRNKLRDASRGVKIKISRDTKCVDALSGRIKQEGVVDELPETENAEIARFKKAIYDKALEINANHLEGFLLRIVDGLEYKDIARMCRIPRGTVSSSINKIKGALQEAAAPFGIFVVAGNFQSLTLPRSEVIKFTEAMEEALREALVKKRENPKPSKVVEEVVAITGREVATSGRT